MPQPKGNDWQYAKRVTSADSPVTLAVPITDKIPSLDLLLLTTDGATDVSVGTDGSDPTAAGAADIIARFPLQVGQLTIALRGGENANGLAGDFNKGLYLTIYNPGAAVSVTAKGGRQARGGYR